MKRFKSADILKGLSMILIILVHYNFSFNQRFVWMKFFQMGCQILFVVSGFVVATSFAKKSNNESFKDASKKFYISRIMSIMPGWYMMLFIVYGINTIILSKRKVMGWISSPFQRLYNDC